MKKQIFELNILFKSLVWSGLVFDAPKTTVFNWL
jgi:hypothetical protein